MKQMFPHGVDEARARHDYSKQLFAAGGSPLEMKIKREEETRRVEEISPADNGNGTDVDMDHEDDEQTPSQDEDQRRRTVVSAPHGHWTIIAPCPLLC